ncbi:MAG: endonuclease [Bacteroidales bacterium]|nr:endonuclease [Bacteroidales bacterium]
MASVLWREPQAPAKEGPILVMFWNLENFFDWKADSVPSNESDEEFSSYGKKRWTKRKFLSKCNLVAKSILWIADERGRLPDVIGLAEAENRFVLEKLLAETVMRRKNYAIVHYDSPDPRGIDVALLYRKDRLSLLSSNPYKVYSKEGTPLLTRDILLAGFLKTDGDSVAFLVNHHPSKYGANSSWRRDAAMERLLEITDSLKVCGWNNIVAMGDFNDTPSSTVEYSKNMINLAAPLARKGRGTIKYSGKWEMIDMFFVSSGIKERNPDIGMNVERIPFLTVMDNTHSGEKPLRSYSGPRYIGGVSDHCPVTLVIQ